MKVQNFSHFNSKKIGTLTQHRISQTTKKSGFQVRNSGKINAFILIQTFMQMLILRNRSYQEWAMCLSDIIKDTVSKQAISNRLNDKFAHTLKLLLKDVIADKVQKRVHVDLFKSFKSVWIQDSTTVHLPDAAGVLFSGNVSKGKQKSVAKLNIVVNLLSGNIPVMDWHSFTENEQKISSQRLSVLKKGDLLIRDLGYFVISSFERLAQDGVFFLSKLRYGVRLYNPTTLEPIELSALLGSRRSIDIEVLCGSNKNLKVRLVAIKLSVQQANDRIRKAKHDRDKRLNHSKTYYKLLEYVIFITNVKDDKWTVEQVAKAYRSRWNIEILFKSWKSGIHITDLIPQVITNVHRIECILYLILLYLSWFQQKIYMPLKWNKYFSDNGLSIMRLVKLLFMRPQVWLCIEKIPQYVINEIKYYCCYDVRSDRTNSFKFLSP
jgi:hypothetical protein